MGGSCKVISGSWYDPYAEQTYSDPQDIDIDHVVPLAEAWRSGASSWDDKRRESYANDPLVLLSVEDNANQKKGDKGPEAWKPQRGRVMRLCPALDPDQGQVRSQRRRRGEGGGGADAQHLRGELAAVGSREDGTLQRDTLEHNFYHQASRIKRSVP